jgi:hypothetical protein
MAGRAQWDGSNEPAFHCPIQFVPLWPQWPACVFDYASTLGLAKRSTFNEYEDRQETDEIHVERNEGREDQER